MGRRVAAGSGSSRPSDGCPEEFTSTALQSPLAISRHRKRVARASLSSTAQAHARGTFVHTLSTSCRKPRGIQIRYAAFPMGGIVYIL